jgi:hypothetical protein
VAKKIDKGMPIPAPTNPREKYPIRELEVGDSFAVVLPTDPEEREAKLASVRATTFYYKKKYNIRCSTRQLRENGKRVLRVWRVE